MAGPKVSIIKRFHYFNSACIVQAQLSDQLTENCLLQRLMVRTYNGSLHDPKFVLFCIVTMLALGRPIPDNVTTDLT